jgi:hypothetical protein
MYDVIFIDDDGAETALAHQLASRADAAALAKREAAARGAGRMVLAGSTHPTNCVCVVHTALRDAA